MKKLLACIQSDRKFTYAAIVLTAVMLRPDPVLSQPEEGKPTIDPANIEQLIHAGINEVRSAQGLANLGWDGNLARIARYHSKDMSDRNYVGHHSPEGDSPQDRYDQAQFHCAIRVGDRIYGGAENIALTRLYNYERRMTNAQTYYAWNSAEEIARSTIDGWMKSAGHRRNILTPYIRHEGIGVVVGPGNQVLITQNFC